jgi:hypothetical protein
MGAAASTPVANRDKAKVKRMCKGSIHSGE